MDDPGAIGKSHCVCASDHLSRYSMSGFEIFKAFDSDVGAQVIEAGVIASVTSRLISAIRQNDLGVVDTLTRRYLSYRMQLKLCFRAPTAFPFLIILCLPNFCLLDHACFFREHIDVECKFIAVCSCAYAITLHEK